MVIIKIGIIGLGRMGNAVAQRLHKAGFELFGFDPNKQAQDEARTHDVHIANALHEIPKQVDVIWLMIPAGQLIDDTLAQLIPHCTTKHIIVDGGNSHFKHTIKRAALLKEHNIPYLDCGTSGGLAGREIGFSLMVGGDKAAYTNIEPLLQAIAAKDGYGHVGPSGAGHYVKMVHNGIEYALLQAYAEGFHIIKDGYFKDEHLDLAHITRIWQHGSIIRSYLLDLAHEVFKADQEFTDVVGEVAEGGTGRWTAQEADEQHIPAQLIDDALRIRAQSREAGGTYATKVVTLLRHAFGGHAVTRKK